jgi:hypothetical protein
MNGVRLSLWFCRAVTCALALGSLGCRDMLGPEKMITTTVLGTVTVAGKPVSQGWIEFVPVEGTVGRMRSARLQKDGTFTATKVPVGVNLIRLINVDIENVELRRGLASFASPIRRTITDQAGGRIKIDVIEEYVKGVEAQARKSKGGPAPRLSR